MKQYLLRPKREGYNDQYDCQMDPAISNVFASASFRFGHTMVPDAVFRLIKGKLEKGMDANDLCFGYDSFRCYMFMYTCACHSWCDI